MALIHYRFSRAYLIASKNVKKQRLSNYSNIHKNMLYIQKTGFLLDIRAYRLDKSIEEDNMAPNNPDLKPAGYSILEILSQRLYKHQRIRDMQHLKDLLEEKREELPQYESDACIDYFFLDLLLNEMCDCCLSWHVQVICYYC